MGTTHQNAAFIEATYDRAKQYANQPAVSLHEYACGTIYASPAPQPDPLPGSVTKWLHPCDGGTNHHLHHAQDLQRDVDHERIHHRPEIAGEDLPAPGTCDRPAATPMPHPANQAAIRHDLVRIIAQNMGLANDPVQRTANEIVAGYYLIPRHDFPDVPANAARSNAVTVGPYCFSGSQDRDTTKLAQDLAGIAAWIEYLEQQQVEAEAKEAILRQRRDTLAHDLATEAGAHPGPYSAMIAVVRAAIDRIIALEDYEA